MRSRQGFTLLEVMVAIAVMGLIMTLLWSSTAQSLRGKERIEKRDMVFHAGGVALRKMAEDLTMAFLTRPSAPAAGAAGTTPPAAAPAAPGATETPTVATDTMKSFFIGEDSGDADNLRFTSFSHLRLFKDAKESDQCKIAYEIIASTDEARVQVLVRREEAWLDAKTEVQANALPLVEGVKAFNVEYYDMRKTEWVKSWNTEQQDWRGRLPLAVRITLVFADPDDEDKTIPMSTALTIPLWRGPVEF